MRTDLVEIHEEAAADYDAAFDWYLQRSEAAAMAFDREVDQALADIVQSPRRWPIGAHSTRRFLLRRFPYIVVYRDRPMGRVQVLAFAHTSRKPEYWSKRL
jgi:toxin ParE1/3/4